jgi:hypothetical protein
MARSLREELGPCPAKTQRARSVRLNRDSWQPPTANDRSWSIAPGARGNRLASELPGRPCEGPHRGNSFVDRRPVERIELGLCSERELTNRPLVGALPPAFCTSSRVVHAGILASVERTGPIAPMRAGPARCDGCRMRPFAGVRADSSARALCRHGTRLRPRTRELGAVLELVEHQPVDTSCRDTLLP